MSFWSPVRAGNLSTPFIVAILTVVLASGCAGADAVLVDGECDQTDSTVTCCLKMNPGQYEKSKATAWPARRSA
jgi:hypothetical protein